jgi:hypothetical protein
MYVRGRESDYKVQQASSGQSLKAEQSLAERGETMRQGAQWQGLCKG